MPSRSTRALAIRETTLGKDHPSVADSLWGLVRIYEGQGLSARAEPLSARALAIYEAAADQNPPNVARSLLDLAHVYMMRGSFARAAPPELMGPSA